MEIIFITIPITILFIAIGVAIFFWASKGGQFDDLDSPAHRILFDDDTAPNEHSDKKLSKSEHKAEAQEDQPVTDKQP